MAQIIWKLRAIRQLNAFIDYSVPEFGLVAFKRMDKRIQEIEKRLEMFPESFTIEPLLKNDKVTFVMATKNLLRNKVAETPTVYVL